jgi:TPR repeat protein
VGNRGTGKSTLLERIRYEIAANNELSKKYISIDFADETRDIYKLYDLWSKIILQLQEQGYIIREPLFVDYEDKMDEYSSESLLRINALLEKEDKILVLFIDNIDRLFKNIKSDKAQLRETLLNYQHIRIFGGSTTMSESFWDYGEAFYEFFSIIKLENLTKAEIYQLLSHWLEKQEKPELQQVIDDNPGKIEAIRIMTGGNPRMMISFMRMLLDNTLETGYDYLRMLIDDATMGYQEKLNHISGQKAKIFSELAYIYEAAQVDQLIQPCKMTSKTISAQLNALIKDDYVEKINSGNKNNLYRVKERFFNIWMIMTQSSPLARQKAKYLTNFLELFYSKDAILSFFQKWKNKIATKEMSADKAIIQAKALYHSKYLSLDDELEIYNTISALDKDHKNALNLFPKALKPILEEAYEMAKTGKLKEAEQLLIAKISFDEKSKYIFNLLGFIFHDSDFNKSEKYYLEAIEKGHVGALYNIANLYYEKGEVEKSEKYYLEAIEKGVVDALNNIANLYYEKGEVEKSEKYLLEAIQKGDVGAPYNLAHLYSEKGEVEKSEKYYLEAIEKGDVGALYNIAHLYSEKGEVEKSEKYYLKAIEKGDVGSLYNLAHLYSEKGEVEKSEKYYLKAIEKGDVGALYNIANLYYEKGEVEKSEKYYLEAIEKGNVGALFNIANLYREKGEVEKSEKYYLKAIEKGDVGALFNIAVFFYLENTQLDEALQHIENYIKSSPKDLLGILLQNIISLATGDSKDYVKNRNYILAQLILKSTEDSNLEQLNFYLRHLLIHHQENWMSSLFEGEEFGNFLMQSNLVYYYVTLMLMNKEDVRLKAMPPELEQTAEDLLGAIKVDRKKYYK